MPLSLLHTYYFFFAIYIEPLLRYAIRCHVSRCRFQIDLPLLPALPAIDMAAMLLRLPLHYFDAQCYYCCLFSLRHVFLLFSPLVLNAAYITYAAVFVFIIDAAAFADVFFFRCCAAAFSPLFRFSCRLRLMMLRYSPPLSLLPPLLVHHIREYTTTQNNGAITITPPFLFAAVADYCRCFLPLPLMR